MSGRKGRKLGLVAILGAMIKGALARPGETNVKDLMVHRDMLLTNGGVAPIPPRMPNQRQRRKLNRQTNNFKARR